MYPGTGRRSGSKPPLHVSRALRWLRRDRKDAGNPNIRSFRRCSGRLNATQPGVFSRQPLVHTGIGTCVQGNCKVDKASGGPATLCPIRQKYLKLQLTLWFYCGKRLLGGTDSLASRANHHALLKCTLLCVAAWLCSGPTMPVAAEGQSTSRLASPSFPVASDARLPGADKTT